MPPIRIYSSPRPPRPPRPQRPQRPSRPSRPLRTYPSPRIARFVRKLPPHLTLCAQHPCTTPHQACADDETCDNSRMMINTQQSNKPDSTRLSRSSFCASPVCRRSASGGTGEVLTQQSEGGFSHHPSTLDRILQQTSPRSSQIHRPRRDQSKIASLSQPSRYTSPGRSYLSQEGNHDATNPTNNDFDRAVCRRRPAPRVHYDQLDQGRYSRQRRRTLPPTRPTRGVRLTYQGPDRPAAPHHRRARNPRPLS